MGRKIVLGSCLFLLGVLFVVRAAWAPRADVARERSHDPAAAGRRAVGRSREAQAGARSGPGGEAEEGPQTGDAMAEAWPYTGCEDRLSAAWDLATSGGAGAAELHAALAHPWPAVRAAAALARIADADQLRRVEALLGDGDWSVRFAVGLTLFLIASELPAGEDTRPHRLRRESLPPDVILSRLAGWPRATRAEAMRILALTFADRAHECAPELFTRLPNLGEPVVALLREMLRAPEVRQDAIRTLGHSGALAAPFAAELSPALYQEANDRAEAASALLRLGCRLDEALVVLAEQPSSATAEWRAFLPLLRRSLAGKGPIPVEGALRVVEAMGPDAAECLPEVLALRESVEPDRLICAFARMGHAARETLPWLLVEARSGSDPSERILSSPRTEFHVLEPLRYGPKPTFRSRAIIIWDDYDPSTPAGVALRGAAEVAPKDPEVVRTALARLDDKDPDVREAATLALRHALAAGDVTPDLIVARLLRDPRERVRRSAASVLAFAAAEREDVASRLGALLEAGDGFSKEYAARALEHAGALSILSGALESEDVGARTWAAAVLLLCRWRTRIAWIDAFDPEPCSPAEAAPAEAEEEPWRARAVAVIEASVRADDPALRRLAVHVMASSGAFPGWRDAAEIASRDPDEHVRGTASEFLEPTGYFVASESGEFDALARARERADEAVRTLLGEAWTPVDVALLAEDGGTDPGAVRTLAVISCDFHLSAFERW